MPSPKFKVGDIVTSIPQLVGLCRVVFSKWSNSFQATTNPNIASRAPTNRMSVSHAKASLLRLRRFDDRAYR
jgi:hypothetical protein